MEMKYYIIALFFIFPLVLLSESFDSYFKQAQISLTENKPTEAITLFKKALEYDVDSYIGRLGLATAYFYQKDYDNSLKQLGKIEKSENHNLIFYKIISSCYIAKEDYKNARKYIELGINNYPKSSELYEDYGLITAQVGRADSSAIIWKKGAELNPAYPGNYVRLSTFYEGISDYISAAYYLEHALNTTINMENFLNLNQRLYKIHKYSLSNKNNELKIDFLKESLGTILLQKNSFHQDYQSIWDELPGNRFSEDRDTLLVQEIIELRVEFYKKWFAKGLDKKYPSKIYERIAKIKEAGLLEAYCWWLMSEGSRDELISWAQNNQKDFESLISLMQENPIK